MFDVTLLLHIVVSDGDESLTSLEEGGSVGGDGVVGLSEEEGLSSRDEDCPARGAPPHMASPARYRCNDSSCSSSQEDATTRLT